MNRPFYLIGRIIKMNYGELWRTVSLIHKKSGKGRLWLCRDIVACGLKYGAGYCDYRLNEFYTLTDAQRATYVTRGINNKLVAMLNDKEYYGKIEDKTVFNTNFGDFIGRDWLDMNKASYEDFKKFMKDKPAVIAKPISATCGQGVEKLNKTDFPSLSELYQHIKKTPDTLVEEYITQHPGMSVLYPHSVNTLRIVTVLTDSDPHAVYSYLRIGNGGHVVDNINAGGMTTPVDLDSGKLLYPAFDKNSILYDRHPLTGTEFVGFQIPFWKESLALCKKAALLVPQLGYIGWDVAVTEKGPTIIEANHFPGHDFLQMPPHVPDKIGMLPQFRKYVKGI